MGNTRAKFNQTIAQQFYIHYVHKIISMFVHCDLGLKLLTSKTNKAFLSS